MTQKKRLTSKIIIPVGMKPGPSQYELDVSGILAKHFGANVEFVPRNTRTTPDFLINNVQWELKSPQGKGKNNIQRQLQYAAHQSANVIIYAGRSKIHGNKIKREVEYQFRVVKSVKRLLFISKSGKVFELNR